MICFRKLYMSPLYNWQVRAYMGFYFVLVIQLQLFKCYVIYRMRSILKKSQLPSNLWCVHEHTRERGTQLHACMDTQLETREIMIHCIDQRLG
jgi:hypothetical protein